MSWMNPYIADASSRELEESDLPVLSPTMQAATVFDQFREVVANKLLWRIVIANRFDIMVDIGLAQVSVFFNYLGPYFLQQIL